MVSFSLFSVPDRQYWDGYMQYYSELKIHNDVLRKYWKKQGNPQQNHMYVVFVWTETHAVSDSK